MRPWFLFILFSALVTESVNAQVIADSVEVVGQRILALPYPPDFSRSDSSVLSAAEFLGTIPSGQLQNITPGGLTTLLHRGHAHRHIPILWEGVNIQNTVNGVFDIALIPHFLMGQMDFYARQGQSPYGNNGLSGALMMQQGSSLNQITCSISSLQNYAASGQYKKTFNRWALNTGIETQYNKNLYTYNTGIFSGQRPSTEFKKTDWIMGLDYYLTPRSSLSFRHWGQLSRRNIPVSISASPTKQLQEDNNFRTQLAIKILGDKSIWLFSATSMQEILLFQTTGVQSESYLDILAVRAERRSASSDLSIYIQNRMEVATPNFYTRIHRRNTWQAGVNKKIQWTKNSHSFLNIRQDAVDNRFMPISISHNLYVHQHEWHFSYNYNLPGFNDLYWPTGGNENLATETSFSSEYRYKDTLLSFPLEATVFGQFTDNWIQWLPSDNGLWTARNQKKVFSRGGELRINYPFKTGIFKVTPSLSYALNIATIADHETHRHLVGRQLIFVPRHKLSKDIGIHVNKHSFHIHYTLTGRRYDLQDESSYLESMHLIHAHYVRHLKKSKIHFRINNLTNRNYSLVRFFPMPGIHGDIIYQFFLN